MLRDLLILAVILALIIAGILIQLWRWSYGRAWTIREHLEKSGPDPRKPGPYVNRRGFGFYVSATAIASFA